MGTWYTQSRLIRYVLALCVRNTIAYVDINTPSPADSGRKVGGERGTAAEARQA